jgi:hypothetical protein
MIYRGEYQCPQCGCGSADLLPDKMAIILGQFYTSTLLRCQICYREFLIAGQKRGAK